MRPFDPEKYPYHDDEDPPPFPVCEVEKTLGDGTTWRCGVIHARRMVNGVWKATCTSHKTIRENPEDYESPIVDFEWCRKYPVKMIHLCTHHGGSTPVMKQRSEDAQEGRRWDRKLALALHEIDPVFLEQNPTEGLLEEVARSAQAVMWLATQVAKLHFDDPDEGMLSGLSGFDGEGNAVEVLNRNKLIGVDHNMNLQTHPLWNKLDEERMRHAKLCALAIQVGLSEKMVNVAQAQAAILARTLQAVLNNIGLPPDKVEEALLMVAHLLRSGGSMPNTNLRMLGA